MTRLSTWIFGEDNRIGRRLIIMIIAFSSVITLVNSGIQLFSEYRSLHDDLDRELEGLSIYMPSLSGSVWDFDEKQIQLSLNALALLPNIENVSVTTASIGGKTWYAGRNASANTITKTYFLRYTALGKDAEIGRFTVTATLEGIQRQVMDRALGIILSNGIKTFLVALFMAYLFRRVVTDRLEALSRKAAALVPQTSHMEHDESSEPMPKRLDELDALEWTFDRTAESLGIAVNSLHDLNDELSRRIAEQDALLQNAIVGIVLVRNEKIVSCNRRFEQMMGFESGALIGKTPRIFYSGDEEYVVSRSQAHAALSEGKGFSDLLKMVRSDGSSFWGEISGRALDAQYPHAGSIWVYADVTERKSAEEKAEFVAYHDALTGLPNRLLFKDRFEQAMSYADHASAKVGLLVLDLDNFKTINDSLGHAVGDGLIKHVAQCLTQCLFDSDTICRQGGDEFLVALPHLPESETAAAAISKILETIGNVCEIDGYELSTSVSVGVAIYPDDGADFETLMKKADMAMYRAKDAGRNTYRFFDGQMQVEAQEQLNMRSGLRRAIVRNEFVLHYQPQIDLARGAVIGVEALLRWNHPEMGMIPPNRFIPAAEDSGLIVPIGEWVLRESCRQAMAWNKLGISGLMMAVNLSSIQFKRGDIERSVNSALQESGFDSHLLELELTESILIDDTESVLAKVKRLKQLGVKLSIDDFGTGYSSLSYLKRFQVDKLKIDQSFVRDVASDAEDAAIVRTIIQVAKSFGLSTIAEGVEDESSLQLLREYGCGEAQGYYFAKPMPAQEFPAFFARMKSTV
ncbi:MAG: EAL domain-containing protein [Burkholderiales bacterium]|nr:EAL domain-containing protein [Burkholderiales bacterium]